ncbi:DUF624 domain-containing protein [Gracilibacillus oryzae]|uniref:DUF624 domain-containing protein n=1 Tax=Gracilibacillus oryzae TaxID=1672701 RepID=A0A7C8KX48_9BACI|nr:DUF624 domain-containing protein [Gracilibacillus oryzae]KAB8127030.1 DUF624 domain-containing protein [Gracilibacillus oryzae]
MELDGLTGKVYKITDWVMTVAIANLFWFLFNLPIVYFSIAMLLVDNSNEWIALLILIVFFAPFVFFPSTTAMFAIIRNRIMNIEENKNLFRSFISHYKANYVRSMLGGLILCASWVILAVDYYFFTEHVSQLFSYIFIIFAFFLLVCTLHFFSVTVHMHSGLLVALKNAILITLGNPLLTLGIGLLSGLIIYGSFHITTFLIPFFMGSIIAYASYLGFFKFFSKVQSLQ